MHFWGEGVRVIRPLYGVRASEFLVHFSCMNPRSRSPCPSHPRGYRPHVTELPDDQRDLRSYPRLDTMGQEVRLTRDWRLRTFADASSKLITIQTRVEDALA